MGTKAIDDRGSPDHVAVDQDLVGHVAAELVDAVLAVQQPMLGEPRFPRTDEGRRLPVVAEQMIREVEFVAEVQRPQRNLQMVGPPRVVRIEKCDVRRAVGDLRRARHFCGARAGISLPTTVIRMRCPDVEKSGISGIAGAGQPSSAMRTWQARSPLPKDRRQRLTQDAGFVLIMRDDYRDPALTPRYLTIGTWHFRVG